MEDINNRGNWVWDMWAGSVLASQFLCKSEMVLQNKVYLKGKPKSLPILKNFKELVSIIWKIRLWGNLIPLWWWISEP